jgi:hypothetical protein
MTKVAKGAKRTSSPPVFVRVSSCDARGSFSYTEKRDPRASLEPRRTEPRNNRVAHTTCADYHAAQ